MILLQIILVLSKSYLYPTEINRFYEITITEMIVLRVTQLQCVWIFLLLNKDFHVIAILWICQHKLNERASILNHRIFQWIYIIMHMTMHRLFTNKDATKFKSWKLLYASIRLYISANPTLLFINRSVPLWFSFFDSHIGHRSIRKFT